MSKGGKKSHQGGKKHAADDDDLDVLDLDDSTKVIQGETKAQRERRLTEQSKPKEAVPVLDAAEVAKMRLLLRQLEEAREHREMLRSRIAVHYENKPVPLREADTKWTQVASGKWIRYEQFKSNDDMPEIIDLFTKGLSEPYTVFTYRYFIHTWPDLCVMLFGVESATAPAESVRGTMVGCVTSSITKKQNTFQDRGYIAMLAVKPEWRGHKLGSELVRKSIQLMEDKNCFVVGLETPVTNKPALKLYTNLGFATTKYLVRYYMDGSDAVRLKLWLAPAPGSYEAYAASEAFRAAQAAEQAQAEGNAPAAVEAPAA